MLMNLFAGICLGILQGLTEFLPVSSSGHLVLGRTLLDRWYQIPFPEGLLMEVLFHFGTLLAVCVCYRRQIRDLLLNPFIYSPDTPQRKQARQWWFWLAVATTATVVVVFPLKQFVEGAFENIKLVGGALVFTGLLAMTPKWLIGQYSQSKPDIIRQAMLASKFNESLASRKKSLTTDWRLGMSWQIALIIGVAQGVAALPGVSRAGITIVTALLLGVAPGMAVQFSFILSVPVILLATVYEILGACINPVPLIEGLGVMPLLAGTVAACLVGIFAIQTMIKVVENRNMAWFALYLLPVGLATILFL